MDVQTTRGELPTLHPLLHLILSADSAVLHRLGLGLREGTTPMDVDTHAATEGELPSPHPLCA